MGLHGMTNGDIPWERFRETHPHLVAEVAGYSYRPDPYEYRYEYTTSGDPGYHYCGHCGFWHQPPCSKIKAIEYHPNGSIKRIEYRE